MRNSIWSANIFLPLKIKYSTLDGANGIARSIILAFSGVLPPFWLLHRLQDVTTLVHTSKPPCDSGITWSLDKSL
jgi:hypothetical protein